MKKTYFSPKTEILKIALTQMVAASPGQGLAIDNDGGSASFINEDATGEGMSRQSLWSDED